MPLYLGSVTENENPIVAGHCHCTFDQICPSVWHLEDQFLGSDSRPSNNTKNTTTVTGLAAHCKKQGEANEHRKRSRFSITLAIWHHCHVPLYLCTTHFGSIGTYRYHGNRLCDDKKGNLATNDQILGNIVWN